MKIREEYEKHGAVGYYKRFGHEYENPHELAVQILLRRAFAAWDLDTRNVLDLACGSGEVTLALQELGCRQVTGIDPFTHEAYRQRTGKRAERFTFEEIAAGALAGRRYTLIVCSFALHLLEESRLPGLLYQLSVTSPALIVLTPHKRPQIPETWSWTLVDEMMEARVRIRLYRSHEGRLGCRTDGES